MVHDQEAPGTLVAIDSDLSPMAARDLTDRIRTALEGTFLVIKAAYRGRAWVALGYSSWDEYVTREFGDLHLRPPREQRHEVVQSLREAGMSVRSIASATQLGRGSVERELEDPAVPDGTPAEHIAIQGQDGKFYRATRTSMSSSGPEIDFADAELVEEKSPGPSSVDDVLDLSASVAGVEPLDLTDRAGVDRDRISRLLRDFHGSGSAALPMTIKLASQVAGLVSPVTGESQVPGERLHELAHDVSRALFTLSHVASTLREAMASGQSEAAIKANLRDSRNELDRVLHLVEASS